MRIFLLILALISLPIAAKEPDADKIFAEGYLLYRLEKASWYGTDHFMAAFPEKSDLLGGYLSYQTEDSLVNTIFFRRDNPHHILMRYTFSYVPRIEPVAMDTTDTNATDIEKSLIAIRQDAISRLSENSDMFFKFYENTSPNLIPVVFDGEKKVYILTGPQKAGSVIIGNDYLLTYDNNSKFKKKKKIHNSMLELPYKSEDEKNPTVSTFHSHVNSEAIDPTDICTLLLYRDYLEWKQHYVMSRKYVSIFDMEKENLVIMTRKAWDKIGKEQEKQKKKKEKDKK